MYTKVRDGEVEFNYNLGREEIRYAAELSGIRDLTDDEVDEIAEELQERFTDMLYDDINDIVYDLFPERDEKEEDE